MKSYFTSLVPTSLWILARFSGLAKHKSRYLTKLYSITINCNPLKYRGIWLQEVNVDFFIVIYFIVVYLQKSRFYFSDYLVAKGPVIHRLVGTRLVKFMMREAPCFPTARVGGGHCGLLVLVLVQGSTSELRNTPTLAEVTNDASIYASCVSSFYFSQETFQICGV